MTAKCEMARSVETGRAKPHGYICQQYVEKTGFYLHEALLDLETILNVSLSKEDVYRLVGRAIAKIHRADDSNETVKEICKK